MKLVATETSAQLASAVARELGIAGASGVTTQIFGNGQMEVRTETADDEVVVFQSFPDRVHDRLFELLFALDGLRTGGASRVTAVLPHLPYSRSDRPASDGAVPPARLVAALMEQAGLSRLVTVELHAPQLAGFFRCPVINLDFAPMLVRHLRETGMQNLTIVSPDLGGAKRAERVALALGRPMAIIRKWRDQDVRRGVEVLGEVADRDVLLIDDEINTGQTLFSAADLLRSRGAGSVSLAVAHALPTPDALGRLRSGPFERVIVTDSTGVHTPADVAQTISIASDIAGALRAQG